MPFRRYSGAAGGGGFTPHGLYPQQRVSGFAVPAACRRRRDWLPMGRPGIAAARRRGKRGRDTKVSLPLLTPQPFLRTRLPSVARLNGGLRGLGSGRFSAYMQLSCPEFRLRGLPRITVRGQTVQGGSVPLRKAPLRSSVVPRSTKRPCGPLAFRRATEGSRVQRKMRGR